MGVFVSLQLFFCYLCKWYSNHNHTLRNGQHRYNNMDHSMLTAMEAVGNIVSGTDSKENIWKVNTEDNYHESK